MKEKVRGPKHSTVRMALLVIVLLAIVYQPWWGGTPKTLADEQQPQQRLAITVAPPVLLADGTTEPVVYLQLAGPDGVPRFASQDTQVSLISSNPLVARVPYYVHVSEGESYTVASLTTTAVPGKATITAVARGLAPATAEVETVSPLRATPPLRLALYAAPGRMLPGGWPWGKLSLVLLDDSGNTVPAPEDMKVVLSSSDPEVVRVLKWITIPKGKYFATIGLQPVAVGSATLSAVRSGFVSDFIQVHVVEPGERAEALTLYLSPPVLQSGTESPKGVIVQAVDDAGAPVYFPCTRVDLASSSPLSVDVAALAEYTCDQSSQYTTGTMSPGELPGTATITAAATGLRPASASLVVQGQMPAQLRAYLAPTGLLGAEATPGFIVIQVLDEAGVPFRSHEGIPVRLVGGEGTVPGEFVIPGGRSFMTLAIEGAGPASQMNLWFVNPSLTSAQLSVRFHTLSTTAEMIASEEPLFPGDETPVMVRVQSAGSPLPGAELTWTATGGGTLQGATPETDEKGEGRAVFSATVPGDGTVEVRVRKAGYEESVGQARVAVVAAIEPEDTPAPSLFGIPVLYLFLALGAGLIGYVGYRFMPTFSRTPKVDEGPDEADDKV